VEGSCEHCNERSLSIKYVEVIEYLSDLRLMKKGSAPRRQLMLFSKDYRF
jgi:hypothetical protein